MWIALGGAWWEQRWAQRESDRHWLDLWVGQVFVTSRGDFGLRLFASMFAFVALSPQSLFTAYEQILIKGEQSRQATALEITSNRNFEVCVRCTSLNIWNYLKQGPEQALFRENLHLTSASHGHLQRRWSDFVEVTYCRWVYCTYRTCKAFEEPVPESWQEPVRLVRYFTTCFSVAPYLKPPCRVHGAFDGALHSRQTQLERTSRSDEALQSVISTGSFSTVWFEGFHKYGYPQNHQF